MDTETMAILVLIGYILVGAVLCFFGSRWAKIIVAIYGFAGGFMLAYMLLPMLAPALTDTLILFISLGVGVVAALLFVLLFYVGIFFVGFGAGVALCLLIAEVFSLNLYVWYIYVPALIICCVLGSLTLNNRRIFLSIFTAYIGASALAMAVYQISSGAIAMPAVSLSDTSAYAELSSPVYLIALAVLFVAGLVIQLAVTSKKKSKTAAAE
jgi:hypothetical protein